MGRHGKARRPNSLELRQLSKWVEEAEQPRQRRRALALVLYAEEFNAQDIAAALQIHRNTVYADLHAFDREGLAAVQKAPAPGAPVRIAPAQVAEILRLAEMTPGDFGLPWGRWSLANLRAYLMKQRIVRSISHEHLRQLLKKGGFASAASSAN